MYLFGQTFDFVDLPSVLIVSFIEIIFSADNAIVISLIVKQLPSPNRKKALFIGFFSALLLRAICLIVISLLLRITYLQLIGSAYLFYLSWVYFHKTLNKPVLSVSPSFWKSVFLIELFDLIFALDSILAGLAFIAPFPETNLLPPKLWIVICGASLGMIAIRFGASFLSQFLERFPRLEKTAYLLITWVGMKLVWNVLVHEQLISHALQNVGEPFYWTILVVLFILGFRSRHA